GGWNPITLQYEAVRDTVVVLLHVYYFGLLIFIWNWWQKRGDEAPKERPTSTYGRPLARKGSGMARTDANPPMMPYTDEYTLVEVDADYLTRAVKPKQFIHIDQTECIACEGCVDICPWKCIHMVSTDAVVEAEGTEQPGVDPSDAFM